ncbi:MAG TPA: hypothetical protein VN769_01180 [Xanthobacteraceae bacterium]|nr:hypothetical protein [Xanthobacteraceae bacterium]
MISAVKIRSVTAMLAFMAFAVPAHAADALFPPGSRIGLVPPAGMTPGQSFQGFGDRQRDAAILITALPADAYGPLEKTGVPDVLHTQGITVDKREPIDLKAGKGFLITGIAVTDKKRYRKWLLVAALDDLTALVSVQAPEQDSTYSDKILRAALATLTVRATVPDAERLSLVPFTVGDLAGFHVGEVLPGRALLLIDARGNHDAEASGFPLNARLLIAALPGGPAEPNDWANFARETFDSIVGIKDVQVQMSEPLRISSQSGYQTLAKAKEGKTDTDIMVVQWLRFGTGGFMQMIGISRADVWSDEFPRLRAVRDSIDPK